MALFDLDLIKHAFFKEKNYEQGVTLLQNADIIITNVSVDKFTDEKSITASISYENDTYTTTITLKEKEDYVTLSGDRSCNCDTYKEEKENCEHMACLINYLQPYKFNELSKETINSSDSSSELVAIIQDFKNNLITKVDNSICKLTPQVEFKNNKFYISFYINKKYAPSYQIKNILEFLELLDNKATFFYSSTNEIVHDEILFTTESQKIIEIIRLNKHLIEDEKFLVLLPDLFFIIFNNMNNFRIVMEKETLVNVNFHVASAPFSIVERQSGECIKITLKKARNYLLCNNCYLWSVGKDVFYYLNNNCILQKLLNILEEHQMQLSIEDYIEFKIFVESAVDQEIPFEENINFNFKQYGLEDIKIDLDYKKDEIIVDIKQLDLLNNNDFQKNINYMKLIKIYQLLVNITTQEDNLLKIKQAEDMYTFLTCYLDLIKAYTNAVSTSKSFDKLQIINVDDVVIDVKEDDSDLLLDVKIKGLNKEEIRMLLQSIKQANSCVKIKNKIINLNSYAFAMLVQLYDLLLNPDQEIDTHFKVDKLKLFLIDNIKESFNSITINFTKDLLKKLERIKNFKVEDYHPETLINCELRDYQKEGINYILSLMNLNYGCILADEMGLGKTIQSIAVCSYFLKQNKKVLITAPTSLIYNWQLEIKRFLDGVKVLLVIGDGETRKSLLTKFDDYDIILTSYELLKRDKELYKNLSFDLFVLDEAQFIKNFHTQNYTTITSIKATHKLAITGTPIENGVKDLWSIVNFVLPGFLGMYRNFYRFFEQPIIMKNDDTKLTLLKKITAPFIIRRLKKDVLTMLPSKEEIIVYNQMNEEQQQIYQEYIDHYQIEINENKQLSKVELLRMIMRLRQIANDPRLINPNYPAGNKINSLKEIIFNCVENNEKILVFSQFVKMLDLIIAELDQKGIKYYVLTGKTSKEQRQKMVNDFGKADNEVFVFFISLKAGGTGLNLTSANNVILVDPWWNKSVENQAADRAHRIGQKKVVYVRRLITLGTIEDRIMDIQATKSQLSQNLLTEDIINLEKLDIDELKKLIS